MTANAIEQLRDAVVASLRDVVATIDPPADAAGRWFADFTLGQHQVVVEWVPERGFGVSAQPDPGFGEGPEEALVDAGEVAARVLELLRTHGRTQPPREVRLRELREQVARLTQEELASQLGVQQAAVSKLERRTDTSVSTLRKAIEAMGGSLEILARFPDDTVVRITQFD